MVYLLNALVKRNGQHPFFGLFFEDGTDRRPGRDAEFIERDVGLFEIRIVQQGRVGIISSIFNHIGYIQVAIEQHKRQVVPIGTLLFKIIK